MNTNATWTTDQGDTYRVWAAGPGMHGATYILVNPNQQVIVPEHQLARDA